MAVVPQIGTERHPPRTFSGPGLMDGGRLRQLWSLRPGKRNRNRGISPERGRGVHCNLYHAGDVYAIQWSTEDFPGAGSRCAEADRALTAQQRWDEMLS